MQTEYIHGQFKLKGIKNLTSIVHLINHPSRAEIDRRFKIISFFDKYGYKTTKAAFNVSRSSIYLWKKKLRENGGSLIGLAPESKAPRRRRKRTIHPAIVKFTIEYRIKHPKIGQYVIKPMLDRYCDELKIKKISMATVGRLIKDLKKEGKINDSPKRFSFNARTGALREKTIKKRRKQRRKGYRPENPGDLTQLDSITIFRQGIKRYLVTAIDLKTRFAFAYAYKNLSSASAKDFMKKYRKVSPFEVKRIQTDNGGEFEKHFRNYVEKEKIIHYHTYPRRPQTNGCIERFNRTVKEQHINWNIEELRIPQEFNKGLMDYLLWYNTEKPHRGLEGKTPMESFLSERFPDSKKSNMYGYRT